MNVTINLPWGQATDVAPYIQSIKNIAKGLNSFERTVPLFVYDYITKADINAHVKVIRINGTAYTLRFTRT